MSWKTKQIKVSSEPVTVRIVGTGQPLVVLHGWGSRFASWEVAGEVLGKKYQIFMFELPGAGSAPEPDTAWGVSEYAQWVNQVIKKLKIKKVILLGHSNGGRVGIKLGSQRPSWLTGLVLVNSAGIPPKNQMKKNVFKYPAKLGKIVATVPGLGGLYEPGRKLIYKLARESDYVSASPLMREVMVRVLGYDGQLDAGKTEVPTLLIWGGRDTATPLWMGEKLNELIENSKLVVVSEATHGLPIQNPEMVLKEINIWNTEIENI